MDLKDLKGVGKVTLVKLEKNNIHTLKDVVLNIPKRYINYEITDDFLASEATIKISICSQVLNKKIKPHMSMQVFYGYLNNIKIKFISFGQDFLQIQLKKNMNVIIYGAYNKNYEYFLVKKVFLNDFSNKIETKYNLKEIPDTTYSKIVYNAFENIMPPRERLPLDIVKKYSFLTYADFLMKAHFPLNLTDLKNIRRRKTYEKFFWYYLALALLKEKQKENQKIPRIFETNKVEDFIKKLPFTLTIDQDKAIREILEELKLTKRINRLIQGDVGCGKTIVAFIAAYATILSGYQVAFIAPTEILAQQHYSKAKNLFTTLQIELLTSSLNGNEKKRILASMEKGEIDLVIGTHSLIQKNVKFLNLGLVIIDEQQRFGVEQRSKLLKEYPNTDALYFTATPIPRTLGLTIFGDLDITSIHTMPKNRKETITKVIDETKLDGLCNFIENRIKLNEQVFIVVPLISEGDDLNLWDINSAKDFFTKRINARFEFLHGKVSNKEKEDIMNKFQCHEFDVLVSTTIVEVGIDIPNASVLVLLNAERFGLSSCHQLRGRIGRGNLDAYFFLVSNIKDNKRLEILEKTNDGFILANEDFKLRGPGDYLGKLQSGHISLFNDDLDYELKVSEYAKEDAYRLASNYSNNNLDEYFGVVLKQLENKENETN